MTPIAIVRRALLPLLLAFATTVPTSSARPSPSAAASEKLVDACKHTLRPDFCLASLSADARSTGAGIHGLAAIATDLATINATAIFSKISTRLLRGVDAAEDGVSRSSLEACLILYRSILTPLHFAAEFLAAKRPDVAAFMFKDPSFAPAGCSDLLGDAAFTRSDFDNYYGLVLIAKTFTQLSI